jgi:hypothetical protein
MPSLRARVIVRDYEGLIEAIRARRDELRTTPLLDNVSGVASGYSSKLLSDPPIRMLGAHIVWMLARSPGARVGYCRRQ